MADINTKNGWDNRLRVLANDNPLPHKLLDYSLANRAKHELCLANQLERLASYELVRLYLLPTSFYPLHWFSFVIIFWPFNFSNTPRFHQRLPALKAELSCSPRQKWQTHTRGRACVRSSSILEVRRSGGYACVCAPKYAASLGNHSTLTDI